MFFAIKTVAFHTNVPAGSAIKTGNPLFTNRVYDKICTSSPNNPRDVLIVLSIAKHG